MLFAVKENIKSAKSDSVQSTYLSLTPQIVQNSAKNMCNGYTTQGRTHEEHESVAGVVHGELRDECEVHANSLRRSDRRFKAEMWTYRCKLGPIKLK